MKNNEELDIVNEGGAIWVDGLTHELGSRSS